MSEEIECAFGKEAAMAFCRRYITTLGERVALYAAVSEEHGAVVIASCGDYRCGMTPDQARVLADALTETAERFPDFGKVRQIPRLIDGLLAAAQDAERMEIREAIAANPELADLVKALLRPGEFPMRERAYCRSTGAVIVEPGHLPYFRLGDFEWDSFLALYPATRTVQISLIHARRPGTGTWRRLRDALRAQGWRITIVCPTGRFEQHLEKDGWRPGTDVGRSTRTLSDPVDVSGAQELAVLWEDVPRSDAA